MFLFILLSFFPLGDLPPRGLQLSPLFWVNWPIGLCYFSFWVPLLCPGLAPLFPLSWFISQEGLWKLITSNLLKYPYSIFIRSFDLPRILGWSLRILKALLHCRLGSNINGKNSDAIVILDHLWVTCFFLTENFLDRLSFSVLEIFLHLKSLCWVLSVLLWSEDSHSSVLGNFLIFFFW